MKRALLFLTIILVIASCREETDSKIIVNVQDTSGTPVENVDVILQGEPTDTIYVSDLANYPLSGITGANGRVEFLFTDFYSTGPDGFTTFQITAVKDTFFSGSGNVILEEGVTTETTVIVE